MAASSTSWRSGGASSGSALTYATFLGGNGFDHLAGVAVDSLGGAWVAGWTLSTNFPVQGAYQAGRSGGGGDVFITRVAPSGNAFSYSTYLGGEAQDYAAGIAVDAAGMVYVTWINPQSRFHRVSAPDGACSVAWHQSSVP